MTVFMTNTKTDSTSEVVGPERRRRWSLQDKLEMVRESYKPGSSVSVVARRHAVNPNQLLCRMTAPRYEPNLGLQCASEFQQVARQNCAAASERKLDESSRVRASPEQFASRLGGREQPLDVSFDFVRLDVPRGEAPHSFPM